MLADLHGKVIRGWNSYDSYGCAITEAEARNNLEIFVQKLKPFGYEYFCLDAGWYCDGSAVEWQKLKAQKRDRYCNISEYGFPVPSRQVFPAGLRDLADRCHAAGVKFGVHVMRGVPQHAAEANCPIKGTPYHIQDILNPEDNCSWCRYWVSGDAAHPGMKAFYQSEVEFLADEIGVDFIKLDDVTEHPDHVKIFAEAIKAVKRPVVLSLSPGNEVWPGTHQEVAEYAHAMRITADVWDDDQNNVEKLFHWYKMENCNTEHCRLDMDMIPIGGLQVNIPAGADAPLGAGRDSALSEKGKRCLLTILAMTGSPLIMGGALPVTSDADLALITHPGMLECNADCVPGKRVSFYRHLDVRKSLSGRQPGTGWIGLFNTGHEVNRHFSVTAQDMGFVSIPALTDVWTGKAVTAVNGKLELEIPAAGCVFLKYGA